MQLPLPSLAVISALIALPAAIWGVWTLLRFLRAKSREEPLTQADIDKERAYLFALQEYVEGLDRPLGYTESEYTDLSADFVGEEMIALRMYVRSASADDQLGLTASDIVPTAQPPAVRNVFKFLSRTSYIRRRRERRPIVVLGEPGSGKSVTLRRVALEAARRAIASKRVWPSIPFYIQLGSYVDTAADGQPLPFTDFLKGQLQNEVIPGGRQIADSLDLILRKGRALILLDSMDEMPSRDFSKRAETLKLFLTQYGGLNRIVVACRKREYTGTFAHAELIIQPFDSRRVKEYLEKHWDLYSGKFLTPEARFTARKSYDGIAQPDHPLFHFATNPFSLKLLTRYFFVHRGELPANQAAVFQSYIEEKLRREAERKDLDADARQGIRDVWRDVAFGIVEDNLGTYISEERALTLRGLRETPSYAVRSALDIAVSAGLMRREANGLVRFEHHRLLEYLAASRWETVAASERLTLAQLENPWWRETLNLRAGITSNPNQLLRQLIENLDAVDAAFKTTAAYFDYIAIVELTLACARQRWKDVDAEVRTDLARVAARVAESGRILGQVRLARALSGFPIAFAAPMLETMATSSSDWLVEEVFGAVDKKDHHSPEFRRILVRFMRALTGSELLDRLRALRGVPLRELLRADPGQSRHLLRVFTTDVTLTIVAPLAIVWFAGKRFNVFDANNIVPGAGSLWKGIALVLITGAIVTTVASWELTVVTLTVPAALSLFLPPRSMFRLFFVLAIYATFIGGNFSRARWIRGRLQRGLLLFGSIHWMQRVFIFFLLFDMLALVTVLYATLGFGVWGFLGEVRSVKVGPNRWLVTMPAALLAEAVFVWLNYRSVRRLLREGAALVDPEGLERFLRRCLAALKLPRPLVLSRRILNRIAELPLDATRAVPELIAFANSNEFFLKSDDVLETIHRIELRGRQQALDAEPAVPT